MLDSNPRIVDSDEDFKHCVKCPDPTSCTTRCSIDEYHRDYGKDIAGIRGETPKQLWGDSK